MTAAPWVGVAKGAYAAASGKGNFADAFEDTRNTLPERACPKCGYEDDKMTAAKTHRLLEKRSKSSNPWIATAQLGFLAGGGPTAIGFGPLEFQLGNGSGSRVPGR
jgi:hypothetical protein